MPVEPSTSSPGCFWAQSTRSASVFQGLLAGTSTPKVTPETCRIGLRSATGSQGTWFIKAWRYTVIGTWPMVWPSGSAALSSGATCVPAAPCLLMTTMGCPSSGSASSHSTRSVRSVWPPAGQGTMSCSGLLGHVAATGLPGCAKARGRADAKASDAPRPMKPRRETPIVQCWNASRVFPVPFLNAGRDGMCLMGRCLCLQRPGKSRAPVVFRQFLFPCAWHLFCRPLVCTSTCTGRTPFADTQQDRRLFMPLRAPMACALRAVSLAAAAASLALPAQAQAQAQGAGKVYVSSEKDNKIYVFDTQGERTGAIDVCKRPRDMSFSGDGQQILVICGDSNAMGLVDVATGKLAGTVPLGDSPEMFDLSPDGKTAYVSIEDENVVAAYDIGTKKAVFEVKTGGEPEGVLVTPDGKTAYVTSEVANVVHVIDLATKKVTKNIKVGKRPRRFVLSPDGAELWVTNELDATVSVVDTKTNTEKQKIKFEVKGMRLADITPVGMTLSPDGKSMWVGLGKANHVAQIDMATKAVKNQVLVGKRAWGMGFAPDGKTLYVANGLSDDMTLVDAASGKAIKTVPAGRVPHSILVK